MSGYGWYCRLLYSVTLFQLPFLGPPSTRLAAALSSGSCQCQAAALQLSVHLQELETAGLGKEAAHAAQRATVEVPADVSVFPSADESSELQTQICNSFKSLVVQLQGEQPLRPSVRVGGAALTFLCPPQKY